MEQTLSIKWVDRGREPQCAPDPKYPNGKDVDLTAGAALMRFWFDTEFFEDGRTIELISIGVVAEDGREFYAETGNAPYLASQSDWLKANVLPHLTGQELPREALARRLIAFMGEKPEIWAYYADYDWVALCQLFGRMIDLPKGWPKYCRDVKQLADSLGNPEFPKQTSSEHHALADARWTREAWQFLTIPVVASR